MKFIFNICLISTVLFLGSVTAQDDEMLIGVVEAESWDTNGNVSAAALVITTEEEDDQGKVTTYTEEYGIDDDATGKKLFKLAGKTVEVTAELLEDDDGNIYLKVKSFKIVEPEEGVEEVEIEEEPFK